MKKIIIGIMLLTIISKIIGFGREIVLAYFYGTSYISDAYLISLTIPGTIFSFIGVGIATSFIPLYSKIIEEGNEKIADRFMSNLINYILIGSSVICILVLVFTNPLVKLFASGFDDQTLDLAVLFTRISIFSIFFTGLTYILTAYLKMKNSYFIPIIAGIPFNLTIVISIIISSKYDSLILATGIVTASLFQLLLIIPLIFKKGYRYKAILDLSDKNIRMMILLTLPVILGTSIEQINKLVDRTIASHIAVGGISALNYANRLNSFAQGIIVIPVATVLYPLISKMATKKNLSGLKKALTEAISGVTMLLIPATMISMVFAEPIVKVLFGRGAFDVSSVYTTSSILFFYSIGMIGYGLREIISSAFYSLQDTKTPMINAALAMVMNIILNIILSFYMGISGLALATSISAIFCTIILLLSLNNKIGSFLTREFFITVLKVVVASVIMAITSKLTFITLESIFSLSISLLCSLGVAAIVYLLLIYFMKIEELNIIILGIKRKIKGG